MSEGYALENSGTLEAYQDPLSRDAMGFGLWKPIYLSWVAVKDLECSYHNPKPMLFNMYPYCGEKLDGLTKKSSRPHPILD